MQDEREQIQYQTFIQESDTKTKVIKITRRDGTILMTDTTTITYTLLYFTELYNPMSDVDLSYPPVAFEMATY